LPLAGTYISCIIPSILDYHQVDPEEELLNRPVESDRDISKIDEEEEEEESKTETNTLRTPAKVSIENGRFVVERMPLLPSPSFGDILNSSSTMNRLVTTFENIGLYSSFIGLEKSLWMLWQMMITGESLLVMSPHARTCSQAVLALTSLIAPLQFYGDYRSYYTLYEADFDQISQCQNTGTSNPKTMIVVGTTNPFFMKSLSNWPNALVFPFLELSTSPKKSSGSMSILLFCLNPWR
jgi:hypothetical protein